jgi:CHASE3 domain sensor protein
MNIKLGDLLNAEVKKKLENLEKNPNAKLPKQKAKKKIIKEDKGTDLADRLISQFRKSLRNMSDDEVYSFRERIATAIDAILK